MYKTYFEKIKLNRYCTQNMQALAKTKAGESSSSSSYQVKYKYLVDSLALSRELLSSIIFHVKEARKKCMALRLEDSGPYLSVKLAHYLQTTD